MAAERAAPRRALALALALALLLAWAACVGEATSVSLRGREKYEGLNGARARRLSAQLAELASRLKLKGGASGNNPLLRYPINYYGNVQRPDDEGMLFVVPMAPVGFGNDDRPPVDEVKVMERALNAGTGEADQNAVAFLQVEERANAPGLLELRGGVPYPVAPRSSQRRTVANDRVQRTTIRVPRQPPIDPNVDMPKFILPFAEPAVQAMYERMQQRSAGTP